MSKVDDAISVLNHFIKKKRRRIEEYSQRSTTTENEKIFIGDETQFIQAAEVLIKTFKQHQNAHFGKLPPQSLELEEKVLGAVILENKLSLIPFLKPIHFYSDAHQHIFQACLKCEKIDLSLLVMKLRELGTLELAGGAFYLAELTGKVSSSANIEFHARILIELAIKREIIHIAHQSALDAYEDSTDCFDLFERTEKQISSIRAWIK